MNGSLAEPEAAPIPSNAMGDVTRGVSQFALHGGLQAQFAQPGVIIGPPYQRPAELAVRLADG